MREEKLVTMVMATQLQDFVLHLRIQIALKLLKAHSCTPIDTHNNTPGPYQPDFMVIDTFFESVLASAVL